MRRGCGEARASAAGERKGKMDREREGEEEKGSDRDIATSVRREKRPSFAQRGA